VNFHEQYETNFCKCVLLIADSTLLARASKDIQVEFSTQGFGSFVAKWLFIVTWHNVTYYGGSTTTPVSVEEWLHLFITIVFEADATDRKLPVSV
jgi:hypothetical protein